MSHRTMYDGLQKEVSSRCAIINSEPSLTVQSDTLHTDVGFLLERFTRTGQMPNSLTPPTYGDFTSVGDYQQMLNTMVDANYRFSSLDPAIQQRFNNDPALFLAFMSDESNIEEAIRLGLASKPLGEHSAPHNAGDAPPSAPDGGDAS